MLPTKARTIFALARPHTPQPVTHRNYRPRVVAGRFDDVDAGKRPVIELPLRHDDGRHAESHQRKSDHHECGYLAQLPERKQDHTDAYCDRSVEAELKGKKSP